MYYNGARGNGCRRAADGVIALGRKCVYDNAYHIGDVANDEPNINLHQGRPRG